MVWIHWKLINVRSTVAVVHNECNERLERDIKLIRLTFRIWRHSDLSSIIGAELAEERRRRDIAQHQDRSKMMRISIPDASTKCSEATSRSCPKWSVPFTQRTFKLSLIVLI